MQRRQLLRSGLFAAGAVAAGSLALMSGFARSGGTALEFTGIDGWINSGPIDLAASRGNVVLVNFWTYSCINCLRTIPYLKRWHDEYGPSGLLVFGIHTPEFEFEHVRDNVETYVRSAGIAYPVGQDNEYRTWDAWDNEAWPAFYILDRDGRIVLPREGEDHAHEMEQKIRDLLSLPRTQAVGLAGDDPDLSRIRSPEFYFGSKHPTPQDGIQSPRTGERQYSFSGTSSPVPDEYQLDGVWSREAEPLFLRSARGGLRLRFSAAKLHLVTGAPEAATIRVRLDGRDLPAVEVGYPALYTVVDGDGYGEHLVEIEFNTPGLALYSATFG